MNAAPRSFNPVIEPQPPTSKMPETAEAEAGAAMASMPFVKSVRTLADELRNLIRRDRKSRSHPRHHPPTGGS